MLICFTFIAGWFFTSLTCFQYRYSNTSLYGVSSIYIFDIDGISNISSNFVFFIVNDAYWYLEQYLNLVDA